MMDYFQQAVVAPAVGGGLNSELQGLWHLQERRPSTGNGAMKEIDHVCARDHLLLERIGTGVADSLKPIERHHREHLDELPVPARVLGEALTQPRHGGRQVPVLERRSVAQRSGLALQGRYVVPGVVDRAALAEAASMLANQFPGAQHDDVLGIRPYGGHLLSTATLCDGGMRVSGHAR